MHTFWTIFWWLTVLSTVIPAIVAVVYVRLNGILLPGGRIWGRARTVSVQCERRYSRDGIRWTPWLWFPAEGERILLRLRWFAGRKLAGPAHLRQPLGQLVLRDFGANYSAKATADGADVPLDEAWLRSIFTDEGADATFDRRYTIKMEVFIGDAPEETSDFAPLDPPAPPVGAPPASPPAP